MNNNIQFDYILQQWIIIIVSVSTHFWILNWNSSRNGLNGETIHGFFKIQYDSISVEYIPRVAKNTFFRLQNIHRPSKFPAGASAPLTIRLKAPTAGVGHNGYPYT